MTLIKVVSVEAEAKLQEQREKQKELMVEVMKIRHLILDLFNATPDEGHSNEEIYEWLIGKGISITRRQITPKMNMMRNVFFDVCKDRKTVWHRRECNVCKRLIQLDDQFTSVIVELPGETHTLKGHVDCLITLKEYSEVYLDEAHKQVVITENFSQQIDELKEEVKRLRAMIVFPSENPHPTARRIAL
jgi:hypothetical protein